MWFHLQQPSSWPGLLHPSFVALTVVVDEAASVAPTVLSVAVSIDASPSFNSAVAIVVVFFGKSSSSSTIVIFQQLVPALLELSFPQFSKL